MSRTLLPLFNVFKTLVDIYKKEEPETFEWLPTDIRRDYDLAKNALDNIPGSREWLKAHTYEEDDGLPFCTPMGEQIMTAFGPHHSGSTATRLGWNYKALLNDWDSFVVKSKESLAREEYDKQQLTSTDIQSFLRLNYKGTPISSLLVDTRDNLVKKEVERLRAFFNIHHDYETTYTMLVELGEEKSKDAVAQEEQARRKHFETRISILKHHYMHPSRWNDTDYGSSLFGSINNITEEMIIEMEQFHPNYRSHLAFLKGIEN